MLNFIEDETNAFRLPRGAIPELHASDVCSGLLAADVPYLLSGASYCSVFNDWDSVQA